MTQIKELWNTLDVRRKKQFILLACLIAVSSICEMLTIGAIVPFVALLAKGDQIAGPNATGVGAFLGRFLRTEPNNLILLMGFVSVAAVTSGIRILVLRFGTNLSYAVGADLNRKIFRGALQAPYRIHISRNTSEVVAGIATKTAAVITGTLLPFVYMASAILISSATLAMLLILDVLVTMILIALVVSVYWLVVIVVRRRLQRNGTCIATSTDRLFRTIQDGLGGIREVIIDGVQEYYARSFERHDHALRNAQADTVFVGAMPRYMMELIGITGIVVATYFLSTVTGGLVGAVPTIAAIAFGAQKLFPLVQQIYLSWSSIRTGSNQLREVLDMIEEARHFEKASGAAGPPMQFESAVRFQDVSYSYDGGGKNILCHINLVIRRGDRIGIVGSTGSGKSTLINLFMGLLFPTAGNIWIDEKRLVEAEASAWHKRIAHVPQNIYLVDDTIAQNIAFGVSPDAIDKTRVLNAARRAHVCEFVDALDEGFETRVGERGVKLSGGQRQRIGIARALYKNADVLVFDEATSALDGDTETMIMSEIAQLERELTILLIAHRTSTLKSCDRILQVDHGSVKSLGSYQEALASKSTFFKQA